MVGEQKRKERQAMVAKACMLGYSFELTEYGYVIFRGEDVVFDPGRLVVSRCRQQKGFKILHLAAARALRHAGVPDVQTDLPRATGLDSSASFRLRSRRRKRGRSKSFFEGSGP